MKRIDLCLSRVVFAFLLVVGFQSVVAACTEPTAPSSVSEKKYDASVRKSFLGCDGNVYEDDATPPECTECVVGAGGFCEDDPCSDGSCVECNPSDPNGGCFNGDCSITNTCEVCQGFCAPTSQEVQFTSSPPSPANTGGTYTPTASATYENDGYPAIITSLTPDKCPMSGGVVTLQAVGTCILAANQPGDGELLFAADQVTQTFEITSPAYPFGGFLPPLSNTPRPANATAGSTLPVKFSLGGNLGLNIFVAGSPSSAPVPCNGGAPGSSSPTTSNSGLSYDAASGIYTYAWQTKKEWKGTCRILTVSLTDNTSHSVTITFK